jgi:hypothetical protein
VVWVCGLVVRGLQRPGGHVPEREVGNRVARRLEEEDRAVTSGDRAPAEHDAHPAAERLDEEHPLRHRGCGEKRSVGIAAERSLLP